MRLVEHTISIPSENDSTGERPVNFYNQTPMGEGRERSILFYIESWLKYQDAWIERVSVVISGKPWAPPVCYGEGPMWDGVTA